MPGSYPDLADYTSLLAGMGRPFSAGLRKREVAAMVYSPDMHAFSLYLHIPFCQHRCSYCDFNTYAGINELIPAYVGALCREIELLAESAGMLLPVKTVFFGGGTPSLLPVPEIEQVLSTLRRSFDLQDCQEVTLEANPGTVSLEYMKNLHRLGVNRISLGMQSASPTELRMLEREHKMSEVIQAFSWARTAGFENLNLDLIFGIPEQTMPVWQDNLEQALALSPEHLSLYALTLEHGTPMQHQVLSGLLPQPDPDLSADMYEYACIRLEQAGYIQYEISNWSRPAAEGGSLVCLHNLQYWRNLPYLGLGAGAHGFANGYRTANVLSPATYIRRCLEGKGGPFPSSPATLDCVPVERDAEIAETMMMGLRLVQEGVSRKDFLDRFGESLLERFGRQIDRLFNLGLVEWGGRDMDILRLTKKGRLLGNQVFVEFI
jgi:oxygen-independent coproporphyrinogen III oxidase